ncbi:MAG TPA: hypothetical protein VM578_09510 [Candidatus Saccharimonadales bacterium]|nr:hypothetical protein [Candidatus Saccharimonadales bacterium]
MTPLAYTASGEGQKLHPVVAYHYLNGGPVVGDFHEFSTTIGIGSRLELGYTHEYHITGGDANLSPLWQNGFEIFNGKVNLLRENCANKAWAPAISVGFIARTGVRNIGNYESAGAGVSPTASGKTDGDIYLVGSKTIPNKLAPIILNAGVRGTNAVLWGIGGNAPGWEARAFGAAAVVLKGPAKSTIVLASEIAQQPHHPLNFPTLNIPTTLTYCLRLIPSNKQRVNLDFGFAQLAGKVGPGVDLKARHQFGTQISYAF